MSERNHPSSFDYEFIGSTDGAVVLNDGEQINLPHQDQYRTEGLERPGTQYGPFAQAVRYERPPTPAERAVMHIEGVTERVESLRANATQADLGLAGSE